MSVNRLLFIAFLFSLCLAAAPSAAAAPVITSTDISSKANAEYVVFYTTVPLRHQKLFMLPRPDRVVLDIETAEGPGVALPRGYGGSLVRSVRFGQYDADTARIVVDLSRPVRAASLHHFAASGREPARMVLALEGAGAPLAEAVKGRYPVPVLKPENVAREVGKPIIILDAGHGGKDPGAQGKRGSIEKNVTLEIAQLLRKELLRTGRYRVALTRENDELISLRDRVAAARKAGGDLFISIHADSAPVKNARGLSIYTLSETASDEESAALAAQENKSDIIAGVDLSHENNEVAGILIDLAQRENRNKSSALADLLVSEFTRQKITLLPNTHRFGGFRVLKAPDIPSVLIETGFLSNAKDERMIATSDYRAKLARGVITGLDRYFDEHPVK